MTGQAHLLAIVGLVGLAFGCASASVTLPDGTSYTARSIGQSHASAGDCQRDYTENNINSSAPQAAGAETLKVRDHEQGKSCATADGGPGSTGLWATMMAGFAAFVAIFGPMAGL